MTLHPYLENAGRAWLTVKLRELPLSMQRKFKQIYDVPPQNDVEEAVNKVRASNLSSAMSLVERSHKSLGPIETEWFPAFEKCQIQTPEREYRHFKVGEICWANTGSPDLEIVYIELGEKDMMEVHYRGHHFLRPMWQFTQNKPDSNPFESLKT